jgi:RNA polymerase sigma-70 factor (ECF subfamily)
VVTVSERTTEALVADEGFDALYRRDFPKVVALAYALSGSRSAAEELAQEAFLAAFRRWDRIGAYDDPGAWVRRVVCNRSVSVIRRRIAEAAAIGRLAGQRTLPTPMPDDADAFWRAVRSLPARQAQAITLYYVEDRSVLDIASILECAEGTVKAHLSKARAALAVGLGAHPGEEDE